MTDLLGHPWGSVDLLPRGNAHTHLSTDHQRTSRLDRAYTNVSEVALASGAYYETLVLHEYHQPGLDHVPVLVQSMLFSFWNLGPAGCRGSGGRVAG